jgi:hypothetical protein
LAPLVPTCAPSSFLAGDTVKWTRAFAEYPISEGWTANLSLLGVGKLDAVATTAADGS